MTQADSVHSTPPTNTSALPDANPPADSPASPADGLYLPTDTTPEELFQAIGRFRKEARDEIDRLLNFLDETENHMELEPNGDEADASYPESGSRVCSPMEDDEEDDADEDADPAEASLGFLERHPSLYGGGRDQSGNQERLCDGLGRDIEDEHDGGEPEDEGGEAVKEDDEPSLGWTVDGCITNTPTADCDFEQGIGARPPQNRTVVPGNVTEETGYPNRRRRGFAVKRTDRPSNGRGFL